MEQGFNLGAIWSIVKRRYAFFLVPAVLVSAVAVVVAFSLPRSYVAKATILIESQRIPNELAAATVTADPRERLKVIEQRLMARDNLLSIADKFSLYRTEKGTPSPTALVANMRRDIKIQQISVSRSRRNTQVVGFDVSFRYSNATMSARVANELVTSILSQNLESRISRAAETSEFFEAQLRDLDNELLSMEQKIAAFKRDNEATLPETLNFRREQLSSLNTKLELVNQQLLVAEQSDDGTGGLGDAKAQQLGFSLQSKELSYQAIVDRRERLAPLVKKGFVSQKTLEDLDRQITQAEIGIAALKSQMAQEGFSTDPATRLKLLKAQKTELERQAGLVQQSIARTPSTEVEMSAMERDYDNLRKEYSQTKAKLTDAQIGERLEQDRQAERFEVLEQATIPESPAAPNRIQIVAAGGGGAVAIGIALVFILEFLDNSIRTANDLERRLKLRPIAVIPYVTTRQERMRRVARRSLTILVVLSVIVAGLAAVHLFVTPLDILGEQLLQKIQAFVPSSLLP